jgi:uncharacterized integral membrane protein (TIGR00697 family)
MNELIFFAQITVLLGFTLGAHKLGKEALVAWVCILAFIANLFVLKQITLFGLNVTASDAFAIGSLLGLNLIQEYYGRDDAQKTTWVCFFLMLFFALVAKLHLLYLPNSFDESQAAFMTLLNPALRLFIASLSVFFIVQQIDIRFFVFLKNRLPKVSFPIRAGIALTLSQFLDTVLFSFAGLYGIVESVTEIILFSFAIKMIVISFIPVMIKKLDFPP